jgi:hypothetical protein
MVKKILLDKKLSHDFKNELKNFIEKHPPKENKYKEFCNKIINDESIDIIVRHFFENLPPEYKQKVNENCRLLINDELFLPADLLDHDFFGVFH